MIAKRFFSNDPDDGGPDFWGTEEEARTAAALALARWRGYAQDDGEWQDGAEGICWGEIRQAATVTLQAVVGGERFTDYELQEPKQ